VYVDLVVLLSLSVVGFGVLLWIGIASVSFGQQFLNYKSNTIGVQIVCMPINGHILTS
jgi:hypothetical protein